MKSNASIKGIIFDMDGVLCDSEPFICEAACRMFAECHGKTVKPEDFLPFVGAGEDRYIGGVAEKYGVHLSMPSDKDRTYAIYLEIIKGSLQPLPGAKEFIAYCRSRQLKLAVATSADLVKMTGNLREIQIAANTFNACVTGSEVQRKKPDPEGFLLAASKLALTTDDLLVVEDAPNGIHAARAAGIRALGLTSSFTAKVLRDAGASWVTFDLAHVPSGVFDMFAPDISQRSKAAKTPRV